eukprot:gene28956-32150_t
MMNVSAASSMGCRSRCMAARKSGNLATSKFDPIKNALRSPSSISCHAKIPLEVRPATVEEFEPVAKLRSEAYYEVIKLRTLDDHSRYVGTYKRYFAEMEDDHSRYVGSYKRQFAEKEDDHSRYVGSYKRQFAEKEVLSLKQRTSSRQLPRTSERGLPLCECLVAVANTEGKPPAVVGCVDLRLPKAITGQQPDGVPDADHEGCYILNVVVEEDLRGSGIGKVLMKAGMERAVEKWGSKNMYAHVEADNKVAYGLYCGCGFFEHSSESKYASATNLGRLILLQATASGERPSSISGEKLDGFRVEG